MVYNGYYKVMSNIPKMGQLPTPDWWLIIVDYWWLVSDVDDVDVVVDDDGGDDDDEDKISKQNQNGKDWTKI